MKSLAIWSVFALARYAAAQAACESLASQVPACATGCISSAAGQVGCRPGDLGCRCASASAIQDLAIICVITECQGAALDASASAAAVCRCVATAVPPASTTSVVVTTTSSTTTTPVITTTSSASPSPTTTTAAPTTTSSSTTTAAVITTTSSTTASPTTSSSSSVITTSSSSSTGPITTAPTTTTASARACDSTSPCQSSVAAIPVCGQPCLTSAGAAVGCRSGDYECQCANAAAVQERAAGCVIDGCGAAAIDVLLAANNLCSCVTANPTTPCTSSSTATSTNSVSLTSGGPVSSSTTARPTLTSSGKPPSSTTTACSAPAPVAPVSDCSDEAAGIPSCARSCFETAIGNVGCQIDDYACQCTPTNFEKLRTEVAPCVLTSCPTSEIPAVLTAANAVCACANAPAIPPPSAPTCGAATTKGGYGGGDSKPTTSAGGYGHNPPSKPPTYPPATPPENPAKPPHYGDNGGDKGEHSTLTTQKPGPVVSSEPKPSGNPATPSTPSAPKPIEITGGAVRFHASVFAFCVGIVAMFAL